MQPESVTSPLTRGRSPLSHGISTMPLMITCDCGARFEVEDTLSGQDVRCPECQQSYKADVRGEVELRTSLLALFSLVLALAGAFTLVGSVAAVCVGLAALLFIGQKRDRLTGAGYALAGIGLGIAFTTLTVLVVSAGPPLSLSGWLRQRVISSEVDTAATWPASSLDGVCVLPQPSADWVRLRGNRGNDAAVDDLQAKREVVLVHRLRPAYIDIARDTETPADLDGYREQVNSSLRDREPLVIDDEGPGRQPLRYTARKRPNPSPVDGYTAREWVIDIERGGQRWRFVVRAWRKEPFDSQRPTPIYVVRAYAPEGHFRDLEQELTAALDSVRFPP